MIVHAYYITKYKNYSSFYPTSEYLSSLMRSRSHSWPVLSPLVSIGRNCLQFVFHFLCLPQKIRSDLKTAFIDLECVNYTILLKIWQYCRKDILQSSRASLESCSKGNNSLAIIVATCFKILLLLQ